MTEIHICTNDSFFTYPELNMKSKCLICCKEAILESSYIGLRCKSCGCVYDPFGTWMGRVAKMRREKILKLSRRQMSDKTGYALSSIKKFEFTKCSQYYFDMTTKMMEDTNADTTR